MRESMGKEDKIGKEAFRWARVKVCNSNKYIYVYIYIHKVVTPASWDTHFQVCTKALLFKKGEKTEQCSAA